MIVHAINWSFLKDLSVYVLRAFTGIAERCECSTVCMRDHVSLVERILSSVPRLLYLPKMHLQILLFESWLMISSKWEGWVWLVCKKMCGSKPMYSLDRLFKTERLFLIVFGPLSGFCLNASNPNRKLLQTTAAKILPLKREIVHSNIPIDAKCITVCLFNKTNIAKLVSDGANYGIICKTLKKSISSSSNWISSSISVRPVTR